MGHRHMRDDPLAEEALLPSETAIDKLIDDDEVSGRQFRREAANGGQRQHIGHTGAFQCVDVGAVIQMRR